MRNFFGECCEKTSSLPQAFFNSKDKAIDEASALIPSDPKKVTRNRVIGGITCCVVTTSSVAMIVYFSVRNKISIDNIPIPPDSKPKLSFDFTVPQKGMGNIIINNEGNVDVQILSIKFTTNAVITSTPTGPLSPPGSTLLTAANQGNLVTYSLTAPSSGNLVIPASGSKNLIYSFDKAQGVLDVGMLPQQIMLSTVQGDTNATLVNQCSGTYCNDPFPGLTFGGTFHSQDMYRQFPASKIKPQINTLYYENIGVNNNGTLFSIDANADALQLPTLMKLNQQYPFTKVRLSIGGPGYSSAFSHVAKNTTTFNNNVLALLQQFNADGVEINWQYPEQAQGTSFVQLLQNLNTVLGDKYTLSIIGPASPNDINKLGFRFHNLAPFVNSLRVMTNYTNPLATKSDYQSPMLPLPNDPNGASHSVNSTLGLYIHYSFPKEKIVLGIATTYNGNKVSSINNNGIWQPITGIPQGQFGNETGVYYYNCAVAKVCNGGNPIPSDCQYLEIGFMGNYSKTPVIQCPDSSLVFTGESPTSVQTKTNYVLRKNLKGIAFDSLAGDAGTNHNQSLLMASQETIANSHNRTTKSNAAMTNMHNLEWENFVSNIRSTVTSSFIGGIIYTGVFTLIDKLTEKLIDKIIANFFSGKEFNTKDKEAWYFSAKSVVYLTTLYYVGLPMLPAAAGKLVSAYLSESLNQPDKKAVFVGGLTSFFVNLKTQPELHSPMGIALATVSFISSFGGACVPVMAINWCNRIGNFGFFSTSKSEADSQGIDLENQRSKHTHYSK